MTVGDTLPADLARAPASIASTSGPYRGPVVVVAETTSTSDDAKAAVRSGAPSGSVWIADAQSQGRGRQGRVWQSQKGESLLLSLLVRVAAHPQDLPRATLACGLAVREVVMRASGRADVMLKWPNDVVCEGRKVCGILVESTIRGQQIEAVVIGIGLNVSGHAFPPEIRATSLAELRASSAKGPALAPLDRADLAAQILSELGNVVELAIAKGLGPFHARLLAADALRGSRVTRAEGVGARAADAATGGAGAQNHAGPVHGIAEGIDGDGRLCVRGDDGVLYRWTSGEVHLLRA